MRLWSAYLGSVELEDTQTLPVVGSVLLKSTIGVTNPMLVYTLDATRLTEEQVAEFVVRGHPLQDIIPTMVVDVDRTRRNHRIINAHRIHDRKKKAVLYNGAVDAHYTACRFVHFVREAVGLEDRSAIVILYGVLNKSGATYYHKGILSVGGDGVTHAKDISHALVRSLQIPYMNTEDVAKHCYYVLCASFDAYQYRHGQGDWTREIDFMLDVWSLDYRQGLHSQVYTNFFYLFSKEIGVRLATQILITYIQHLQTSYSDYGAYMLKISRRRGVHPQCLECLQSCHVPITTQGCILL